MITAKTPGFTAEISLDRSQHVYAVNPYSGDLRGSGAVRPQLRSTGFCQANCSPGDYLCLFSCMEEGGGGGFEPPTPRCRPGCGPCQGDPDSPTGRSRLCIQADCETYDRQC